MSTADRSDVIILREVLASVSGRPALAPVHAAASALLAELDTAGNEPTIVPPGDIPDIDVPRTTQPHIHQPLGDPPLDNSPLPGTPRGPSSGIIEAELVEAELVGDGSIDQSIGGGVSSGHSNHESPTGFTDKGVPTWASVRDKVELRDATALGAEELDHGSPAGRTLDEAWNEREAAGRRKLDEIRRSMKDS
ncbi:hypothetical protein QMK17_07630 [Rhodococcus sp. G-MC3]|uniref:hypothetical protein n=1 Tax=Rhodococcus sp. G-MC3 TaxID=3046209 RepID=UPI0024B89D20|nr:hypothetical protein [Rhodococcus sp. G-MC3]MDJ0393200.1 hypothetical protein [Rhodococcus sp. G-MC3]